MSEVIPEVKRCPLCDCDAELHEGFDIDCESTTALITCTACPVNYGPIYPDTKADVVEFVERWNRRDGDQCRHGCKICKAIKEMVDSLDAE